MAQVLGGRAEHGCRGAAAPFMAVVAARRRREFRHSAAPPSPFIRRFNRDLYFYRERSLFKSHDVSILYFSCATFVQLRIAHIEQSFQYGRREGCQQSDRTLAGGYRCCWRTTHRPGRARSWLTAAIPMENPYCSCKLTRGRARRRRPSPARCRRVAAYSRSPCGEPLLEL